MLASVETYNPGPSYSVSEYSDTDSPSESEYYVFNELLNDSSGDLE